MFDITKNNTVKFAGADCCTGSACCFSGAEAPTVADTVVYGKIYTSNSNGDYAQAFAVKDGKYVYVGSVEGAQEYIQEGTTKIIDHRDKGLVMAGATEGHGHYAMDGFLHYTNYFITGLTEEEILANAKKYVEANPGKDVYYTFGWNNETMEDYKAVIDMRTKLDAICSDKPMMIGDDSGHNAFCNTKAFEKAGVTKDTELSGGLFARNEAGELLGLVSDMANNFVLKNVVAKQALITEKDYEGVYNAMKTKLHGYGYTYIQDAWLNYFGTQVMDCLSYCEKKDGLSIVVGGCHEIDPYDDWQSEIAKAEEYGKKYTSKHLKYNTIKLFSDGEAVESKSGWLLEGYLDGSHGAQVWETPVINEIVKTANAKGMSVHIHAQGDAASEQAVNAFINAESTRTGTIFNGFCHGRNITEETKKKMSEHNIYAAININWRLLSRANATSMIEDIVSMDLAKGGYPVKSLLDKGINVSSSTDAPATSGAPADICGIMEVAVNGTHGFEDVFPLDDSEKVSIEEALNIMTINGAKQLMIEDERGSIETGKYADFLLLDKDITACATDKIHEGKVANVYFEGEEVYSA